MHGWLMLKVGLTGGLACGKSFVGEQLEQQGSVVIRADELGHKVLEPGGEAYEPALALLGPEILREDGTIDRPRVARLVFGDPEKLEALNAIVHPAVRRLETLEMTRAAERDPAAIIVIEAAILIETGIYKDYDCLIVVACDRDVQIARALKRGSTREDVESRLARQMTTEDKLRYADFVINTSGTKEETVRQTQEVFLQLKRRAAAIAGGSRDGANGCQNGGGQR